MAHSLMLYSVFPLEMYYKDKISSILELYMLQLNEFLVKHSTFLIRNASNTIPVCSLNEFLQLFVNYGIVFHLSFQITPTQQPFW
jgi:hypothetical protein